MISALSVVFVVSFTPNSEAADIGNPNSGVVKDDGYSIKNLALEQSKRIKEEMDRFGPCKAWNGSLNSTCSKSKKKGDTVIKGSSKRMTMDQIISLGTLVKKPEDNVQISPLPSQ